MAPSVGSSPEIPLLSIAYAQARRACATGAPVYVTANPVEYHGPHLSLHNDRLVSEAVIRRIHGRLAPDAPFVYVDDLEAGVAPASGPSSRRVPFRSLRALVLKTARSLAELGARRVVWMTFHGDPMHNHAIQDGVRWLAANGIPSIAPFNIAVRQLVDYDTRRYAAAVAGLKPDERERVLRALPWDFHAGFFETSVALHLAPASVSDVYKRLPPCPEVAPDPGVLRVARVAERMGRRGLAAELRFIAAAAAHARIRPFPCYTGAPHLASAEAGRVFIESNLDEIAPITRRVLYENAKAPEPIMPWLRRLTLGGRLEAPAVPLGSMELFEGLGEE